MSPEMMSARLDIQPLLSPEKKRTPLVFPTHAELFADYLKRKEAGNAPEIKHVWAMQLGDKHPNDSNTTIYNPGGFMLDGRFVVIARKQDRDSSDSSAVLLTPTTPLDNSRLKVEPVENIELSHFEDAMPYDDTEDSRLLFTGVGVEKFDPTKLGGFQGELRDAVDGTVLVHTPEDQKGFRLVKIRGKDGNQDKIGVIGRYRNEADGKVDSGVSMVMVNHLSEVTNELVKDLYTNQEHVLFKYTNNEWGGVNSAYVDEDGNLTLLMHQAYYDTDSIVPEERPYFTVLAKVNPWTREFVNAPQMLFPGPEPMMEQLVKQGFLPNTKDFNARNEALRSVCYSGTFIREHNEKNGKADSINYITGIQDGLALVVALEGIDPGIIAVDSNPLFVTDKPLFDETIPSEVAIPGGNSRRAV